MKHGEKVAAVAAGVLFVVVLVWPLFFDNPDGEITRDSQDAADTSFEVNQPRNEAIISALEWGQPSAQGGPNWIFDIFTPPVIYYDETSGTFTVTPPFPEAEPVEEVFDLELIGIRPVPYRFQLVSYAGARGNYVLTLENLDTGRDVFCSPGETLSDQAIRVVRFDEIREIAASSRAGTTEAFDLVGEAIIGDQRTGKQYTLHHNKITYLENPVAQFINRLGNNVYLAVGDSWESGQATYTVRKVDLSAKTATVEKSTKDVGDKVVKILQSANRFNSDLSNRNTRASEPSPGTF